MGPSPELHAPGRRWVYDDGGTGSVYVATESPFVDEPTLLIRGSFTPPPDEPTVLAEIEGRWKGAQVVRARTPGERHPRIWRPGNSRPPLDEIHAFTGSLASANVIMDRFRRVLRTIEPVPGNRAAFGHELRQLLILAATEVESAWRSILVANQYAGGSNGRYSTNDYSRLRDPLKLPDWTVVLTMHPAYGPISPFLGWDTSRPTTSLPWYDAYNLTKHDREANLASATLEHLISAVTALFVMLAAQVGPERLSTPPYSLPDFFATQQPAWALAEEYVPCLGSSSVAIGGSTTLVPIAL